MARPAVAGLPARGSRQRADPSDRHPPRRPRGHRDREGHPLRWLTNHNCAAGSWETGASSLIDPTPATSDYLGPGVLEAKLEAQAPRTAYQRRMLTLRGLLFGRPLSSAEDLAERLPKWKALPVFSSRLMSSVAYATGAMMLILVGAGTVNFKYVLGLSSWLWRCWSS